MAKNESNLFAKFQARRAKDNSDVERAVTAGEPPSTEDLPVEATPSESVLESGTPVENTVAKTQDTVENTVAKTQDGENTAETPAKKPRRKRRKPAPPDDAHAQVSLSMTIGDKKKLKMMAMDRGLTVTALIREWMDEHDR